MTTVLTITKTQLRELVVQNEAIVINTLYVDEYYQNSNTVPYALTTVSTATATRINRNVGTATVTSDIMTTAMPSETLPASQKVPLVSTSSVPFHSFSQGSNGKNSNTTVIGLAVGLPIAVFTVGLLLVLGLFYYRRVNNDNFDDEDPKTQRHQGFLSKLHGASDKLSGYSSEDVELEKDRFGPSGIYSRVTYKVDKPYVSHPKLIRTPQRMAFPDNPYRKEKMNFGVNSNANSLDSLELSRIRAPASSPFKKWNYESPLSRWFLTKSTLIQDKIQTAKTPTMYLKQLHLLTKASKSTINIEGEMPIAEYSPILPSVPASPYETIIPVKWEDPHTNKIKPNIKSNAKNEYKVVPQIIDSDDGQHYSPLIKLKGISITHKGVPKASKISNVAPSSPVFDPMPESRRRSERYDLSASRNSIVEEKPEIVKVVKDYKAVLMDEIEIRRGELVRVLARHTDGWCLVERHNMAKQESVDALNYLNDDRGIVPGLCLQSNNS